MLYICHHRNMSGCVLYHKLARSFRCYYRTCGESELNVEVKRRFSVSAQYLKTHDKTFSFKSLLDYESRRNILQNLKDHCNEKLAVLGEILTKQCNFVASQRLRRLNQVWNLYTRLYSETSLRHVISQLSQNLRAQKRPFSMLFGIAFFSWEKDKITDEEIENCMKNDEYLLEETFYFRTRDEICICELDNFRSCDDHPTSPITGEKLVKKLIEDGWEAVIQKECIQLWRKAFPDSYLYEYKIMGTFYDVPARAFFAVQTDIEYRKTWDRLVIKLDVIDHDPKSDCEIMHWVMHYPFPMYSREYVYIRRAVISPETNSMVLVSRAIDHPKCPVNDKYVRVSKYSSRMVIRPHRTYDDNGFDYVLTYFDDPQAAFPTPAYNWMASSGVPDFVEKLHAAAKELHYEQKKSKSSLVNSKKEQCTSGNMEYVYM